MTNDTREMRAEIKAALEKACYGLAQGNRELEAENAALREKLEAAEAERDTAKKYMAAYAECDRIGTEACRSLEAQLTEVRAGQAVAWLAGYRAGWNDSVDDSFLTEPPADLTAALAEHDLRVRDAALEEAAKAFEAWGDLYGRNSATYIRALKKGADT